MPIPNAAPKPAPGPAANAPTPPAADTRTFTAIAAPPGHEIAEYVSPKGLTARVERGVKKLRTAWSVFATDQPGRSFGGGTAPTSANAESSALAHLDQIADGLVRPGNPDTKSPASLASRPRNA